jgi:drug/metabolite transporter (DMT)-like permease
VTTRNRAELVLLATTIIWGGTFAVNKIALIDASPLAFITVRFFVATLFFLVFFRRSLFPLPPGAVRRGGLLGLVLFLGFATQTVGLVTTTASKSAFITGMMVVIVPIMQIAVEHRPPKIGNIVGIAVVVAGLWFLTSPAGGSFGAGDALSLVCAFFFAIYIVQLDVVSQTMSTLQLTFLQMAAMLVLSGVSAVAFEDIRFVPTRGLLLSLAYLTVFATVITLLVQTRFQKDTTPTRAAVIFSIEPVIAAVVAALLLGEQMNAVSAVGAALILGGILLSEFSDYIPVMNRPVGASLVRSPADPDP